MELLYWFESIRNPVLDKIMLLVTSLGEETAFLAFAVFIFWCIDKHKGYYILSVGFLGTIFNQFLKMIFRIPRPFELYDNFTAVEAAKGEATGFSFPSGHTQTSVGTYGGTARVFRNVAARIGCICLAVLIPISRMYLGVHTPQDVVVSVVIALCLVFIVYPFTVGRLKKYFPALIGFMLLLAIGYLVFVFTYNFPSNVNPDRLLSGKKNAATLLGAICGMVVVYIVDKKWINFSVKAVWWAQIIKFSVGSALVLAVKEGSKILLNFILGESPCFIAEFSGRAVRYFLVVLVAGMIWPLTFKWFSRFGKKE